MGKRSKTAKRAAVETTHSHRPTTGKQTNKLHVNKGPKVSRHNGNAKRVVLAKGNPSLSSGNKKIRKALRIATLKNEKENIHRGNHLGSDPAGDPPPRNVLLLSLHASAHPHMLSLKRNLCQLWAGEEVGKDDEVSSGPVGVSLPAWSGILRLSTGNKKGTRLIVSEGPILQKRDSESNSEYFGRQLIANLDAAKVADLIVFVVNAAPSTKECSMTGNVYNDWVDSVFDPEGYELLSAIRAQGLCSVVSCRYNGNGSLEERVDKVEHIKTKNARRYATSEFGDEAKFFDLTNPNQRLSEWSNEARKLTQCLVETSPKFYPWRNLRGYMAISGFSYEADATNPESGLGKLTVMGYARGIGFSTKQMIHLTGFDNFFLDKIVELEDPIPRTAKSNEMNHLKSLSKTSRGVPLSISGTGTRTSESQIVYNPLPVQLLAKSLVQDYYELPLEDHVKYRNDLVAPTCEDTTALEGQIGEQTWPLEEEILSQDEESCEGRYRRSEESADEDSGGHHFSRSFEDLEDGSARDILMKHLAGTGDQESGGDEDCDEEEMNHIDEVESPAHLPASEVYREYRGLNKGFRHSYWDPMQELPPFYGRIYDFQNYDYAVRYGFHLMRQDATINLGEESGNTESKTSGKFISMELANVPVSTFAKITESVNQSSWCPLVLSSVNQFESKFTLLHATITRRPEVGEDVVISSNMQGVTIQAGFQRRPAEFILSEDMRLITNCKKSLVRRTLHSDKSLVASFFGPCLMPGSNILYLMDNDTLRSKSSPDLPAVEAPFTMTPLFANGTVQQGDAKRMLIKRSILTGYPHKIHKNSATIRFMFHNPKDVNYFQPIQLETLSGKHGHITMSVGDHGRFKATFEDPVDSGDVVCLKLYKRVFPNWPAEL
eukprot:GHVH01010641.1.p1 GENE.GHVH01010641.1~~GHVH01010641.1.p1  ORF type:complete len:915 (+),score=118.56 GHVH01010641.1:81-2747(+)